MKKLIDITIASFIGLLILIAGMTRFHHHLSDEVVCFCIDAVAASDCCHHHNEHSDEPATPFGDGSENSCPLHLDYFNISETHDHNHFCQPICCDHLCDICSPQIYSLYCESIILYISLPTNILESDGHDSAMSRRGPPALVA